MKPIIKIFKKLKNIESKPKRFLLGFSTVLFVFEIIWNISFILDLLIDMLDSYLPFKSISDNTVILSLAGPNLFCFPYLAIISICISSISYFLLLKCKNGFYDSKYSKLYVLFVFANPTIYVFIYMTIQIIRVSISLIGY